MIDSRYFILTKDLRVGQKVRWYRHQGDEGVGTITLIWLGIEEMVDVDAGYEKLCLCPALGDRIVGR